MLTVEALKNLSVFPIIVQTDCKKIYRVYPLKQRMAAEVYDIAKKYPEVRKVYLFGSAVTNKCHRDSDLDVCVDMVTEDGMKEYDLNREIGDACNWDCDILMYRHIGSKLRNQIEEEGVVIYEQSIK